MDSRILGVDFGDVRTGLAVSDVTGFLASGAGTIKGGFETTAEAIADFCSKHNISKIVLGHPVNMNGTLGERSQKIHDFKKRLEELTSLEVVLFDERLSTANAHTILNITNTKGKKRKEIIDEMSACLILQSYLDRERSLKNG